MSDYCKRCDRYSAEVGRPNDEGLCPLCALRAMIEWAIKSADWEPGDAQRALRELRDDYVAAFGDQPAPSQDHKDPSA